MHGEIFHERIRELYRMLFELSNGNLKFRIEGSTDEIGKLADALNTFAAQMHLVIKKSGHVVPYCTYRNSVYAALLLDEDFAIVGFTKNIPGNFRLRPEELLHANAMQYLGEDSKQVWQVQCSKLKDDRISSFTEQLSFIADGNRLKPALCTVCRLLESNHYLVSFIGTTLEQPSTFQFHLMARPSEAQVIQNLYEYIMENLESPLPTIKELARLFGTNQFKLKQGFRNFFNVGIHHFYNAERLKRAHSLIQQTRHPLKSIAYMSGFRDYVTFSKAFKRHFGYVPGSVARNGQ